jgi:hypothetical protein
MSAVAVLPCVVPVATAVADCGTPLWRPEPRDGLPFYRRHTLSLLRRYLLVSMQIGRAPSPFGRMVFRGRVSSYRLRTFEDGLIFVLDVEKAIHQLHPFAQTILTHVVLEGYSFEDAAVLTGESRRSVARTYGEAIDRLTAVLLDFGLIDPNVENLSRAEAKIESNDPT